MPVRLLRESVLCPALGLCVPSHPAFGRPPARPAGQLRQRPAGFSRRREVAECRRLLKRGLQRRLPVLQWCVLLLYLILQSLFSMRRKALQRIPVR